MSINNKYFQASTVFDDKDAIIIPYISDKYYLIEDNIKTFKPVGDYRNFNLEGTNFYLRIYIDDGYDWLEKISEDKWDSYKVIDFDILIKSLPKNIINDILFNLDILKNL